MIEPAPPPSQDTGHQPQFDAKDGGAGHKVEKNSRQTVTTLPDHSTSPPATDKPPTSLDNSVQVLLSTRTTPLAPSPSAAPPSQQEPGGQKSSYPPQQGFSSMMGGQGAGSRGDRSEGGGLMMTTTAPAGTPSPLSSALDVVSHDPDNDPDNAVFSPSSVEDERMKFIEQVSECMQAGASGDVSTRDNGCHLVLHSQLKE